MSESASHVGLAVNVGLLFGLLSVITVVVRYASVALMQVFLRGVYVRESAWEHFVFIMHRDPDFDWL